MGLIWRMFEKIKSLLAHPKFQLKIGTYGLVVLISVVVIGLIFVRLSREVLESETLRLDTRISLAVYALRSAWLTAVMQVVTSFGEYVIYPATLALSYVLWRRHFAKDIIVLLTTLAVGVGGATLIKWLVARPRPDLSPLMQERYYSFPSIHTVTSFIFYGLTTYFIFKINPGGKWNLAAAAGLVTLSVLVGFSRVYLGVHYPTDVLGGFLLATVCVLLAVGADRFDLQTKTPQKE